MNNFRDFQFKVIGLKLSIQVHAAGFMPFKSPGLEKGVTKPKKKSILALMFTYVVILTGILYFLKWLQVPT